MCSGPNNVKITLAIDLWKPRRTPSNKEQGETTRKSRNLKFRVQVYTLFVTLTSFRGKQSNNDVSYIFLSVVKKVDTTAESNVFELLGEELGKSLVSRGKSIELNLILEDHSHFPFCDCLDARLADFFMSGRRKQISIFRKQIRKSHFFEVLQFSF